MTWAILAPIIAEHGVDFAFRLMELRTQKEPATMEQWASLLQLSTKTSDGYLREALAKAGLGKS